MLGTIGVGVWIASTVSVHVGVSVTVGDKLGMGVELGPSTGVVVMAPVAAAGVEVTAGWLAVRMTERVCAREVAMGFCPARSRLDRSQA
jgi:hypothetical protein